MALNVDQALSTARILIATATGVIGTLGITAIDPATLQEGFNHIFNGVKEIAVGVGIIGPAAATAWGIWRNRDLKKAQSAGTVPGVTVIVDHTAAPDLQQAAHDPTQPNIKPVQP